MDPSVLVAERKEVLYFFLQAIDLTGQLIGCLQKLCLVKSIVAVQEPKRNYLQK